VTAGNCKAAAETGLETGKILSLMRMGSIPYMTAYDRDTKNTDYNTFWEEEVPG